MNNKRKLVLTAALSTALILSACNQQAPVAPAAKTTEAQPKGTNVPASVTIIEPTTESVPASVTITDSTTAGDAPVSPVVPVVPAAVKTPTPATTTEVTSTTNPLVAYSSAKLAELKGKKPVAIFFHAAWCPVCRGMEQSIKTEPGKIPAGITLLKADYDNESALKKEYNILQQSTWVILDSNGKEIVRNPGFDYESLITDLQKAV